MKNAILLIHCSDQKGITAQVSNFIYQNNGNIEHADQHIDFQTNIFFMRIEWSLENFLIPKSDIAKSFSRLAKKFNMNWTLYFTQDIPRMVIFSSLFPHCLYDLLLRYKENQLNCTIPFIVSNHTIAKDIARNFNLEFHHFPINTKNKLRVEQQQIKLLKKEKIELIILARYTQILSKQFIDAFPNRIINIHHSFLPAFIGNNPYEQASQRGVKIIGATSHYVTEELDAGPIIEQDVTRINHRDSLSELKRKGQDLEKLVLSRAVRWYLERKILIYNNKTVIFD